MANITLLRGACEAPFLQMSNFPSKDGYLAGRFCAPVPTLQGLVDCCLPCPMTDWVYSDNFHTLPTVSNWLNVAGIACTCLLLLTFVVLPVEKTSRHYLTIGLLVAISILQLGFIIPLGAQPQQCHDMITPNDMYSDLTCAFSGAFLITGGFAAILWGFLRSLSLHLQICWQVSLGKKFFWCSLFAGWGIPIVFSAVTLAVTSVSYRFGQTCYINHDKALQDYWGPLLAFAAVSTILQFVTFGYCVRVYIRSLFHGDSGSYHSTGLPSYNGSIKKVPAKVAYGRVRKVLALQWRGIMIVLIILTNVVFLAVVFIKSDNTEQAAVENLGRAEPWLLCLVLNPTDHSACLDKATSLVTKESIVMAAVILLSLNGIWALLFLGRMSMVHGWIDLLRGGFKRSHDFVSVDARRLSATPHNFEMVTRPAVYSFKETEPRITSISSDGETDTIMEMSPLGKKEFTSSEKGYVAPSLSFSSPRPPSAGRRLSNSSRAPSIGRIEGLPSRQASLVKPQGRDWDPSATHAKPLRNNSGFTRI